jgi:uncharacterized membrane protein
MPSAAAASTWYLVLALLGVAPLALLTPPLQVPDEQQHFFRAYQLSEGNLTPVAHADRTGAVLPSSLANFSYSFLGTHALTPEAALRAFPLRETLGALSAPLDPERREFVDFSGSSYYSPLAYLPQLAGIVVGRAFDAGPLGLLYAARLVNGLTSLLVVSAALRILPLGNMLALVAGLLPMTLFLFGSASPDASVISSTFLFTAVAMRARFRGRWTASDLAIACVAGAVFCSLKPVYAPLLAIALPGVLRPGATAHVLAAHGLLFLVVMGTTASWLVYNSKFISGNDLSPDISASAQWAAVISDPGRYFSIVLHTIRYSRRPWSVQFIGQFGWLQIYLPRIMYWVPPAATIACLLLPRPPAPRIGTLEAAWQAMLIGVSGLLILTALYLYGTKVGADLVRGVQGRYFLPLAPLAAVTLSGIIPPLKVDRPTAAQVVLPLISVEVLLTLVVVIRVYSVF